MTNKYLLVFGGSGFVGKEVCHQAIIKKIPVVSISSHGKPNIQEDWVDSPLITWLAIDIFHSYDWQNYVKDAFAIVHLIGVIGPTSMDTYVKMNLESVIMTSEITRQQAEPHTPYLLLSANKSTLLPKYYAKTKQEAENYVTTLPICATVIRSGYIFGKSKISSLAISSLIKILAKIPFLSALVSPVYPISIEKLGQFLLKKSLSKEHTVKTTVVSTQSL